MQNRNFESFKTALLSSLVDLENVHNTVSGEARTAAFEEVCNTHGITPPLYFDETE